MKIVCIIVIQYSYVQQAELSLDFNGAIPNISLIPRHNPFFMKRACTNNQGCSKSKYCIHLGQYVH